MTIPFVIDNQQHSMAHALTDLLEQSAGKPLDIATAYFAISCYPLEKEGMHLGLAQNPCHLNGYNRSKPSPPAPLPEGEGRMRRARTCACSLASSTSPSAKGGCKKRNEGTIQAKEIDHDDSSSF